MGVLLKHFSGIPPGRHFMAFGQAGGLEDMVWPFFFLGALPLLRLLQLDPTIDYLSISSYQSWLFCSRKMFVHALKVNAIPILLIYFLLMLPQGCWVLENLSACEVP